MPLKPYMVAPAAPFKDCISFQEIPGKPGKFLITQKAGTLLYYDPATGASSVWGQLTPDTQYEEGVNTIVFHPGFVQNGRYFALYTPISNAGLPGLNYGHPGGFEQVLEEYTADATHTKASGQAPKQIMKICCQDGPGHSGMYAIFGNDGMLYITTGDGNSDGRDTQTRRTFLGTVSRIDIDHADAGKNYAIPKDNPFVNDGDPLVKKEIWSYGWRQPYKIMKDPLNGDLWIGNVGGWNEDHVSKVGKGLNFGWPITESTQCFDNSKTMFQYTAPLANCNRTGITPPNIPVPHSMPRGNVNTNCVMGPVVYRGNPASSLYGAVFFADHTAQSLWIVRLDANGKVAEQKNYPKTAFQIIHIQESSDGRILVAGLGSNQLYYLDDPALLMGHPTAIQPSARPASLHVVEKGSKSFYDVAGKRLVEMPFFARPLSVTAR